MQNQESLERFIQLSSQDEELQRKLKAATLLVTTDHEATLRSIVEVGKEFGYSFTSSEMAERLDITPSPTDPSWSDLSDWELEAVAGSILPSLMATYHTAMPMACSGAYCTTGPFFCG